MEISSSYKRKSSFKVIKNENNFKLVEQHVMGLQRKKLYLRESTTTSFSRDLLLKCSTLDLNLSRLRIPRHKVDSYNCIPTVGTWLSHHKRSNTSSNWNMDFMSTRLWIVSRYTLPRKFRGRDSWKSSPFTMTFARKNVSIFEKSLWFNKQS